jgi:hypothetical protein
VVEKGLKTVIYVRRVMQNYQKIRRVVINVRVILANLAQQAYAQIVWQIRLLLMKHLRHFYIIVQFAI